MSEAFEQELEELVGRYARELSRDITAIILRRLGVTAGSTAGVARAKSTLAAVSAPQRRPAKKAGGGRAPRATADQMSGRLDRVLRIVQEAKSVSMGDLESRSGLSRPAVAAVIKQLKAENRVFMGGERRFARYATTQAAADRASEDARGG